MSNFLKKPKRASKEIEKQLIETINQKNKHIETLQKRLDDTEKERQILINHIITKSDLKEQARNVYKYTSD